MEKLYYKLISTEKRKRSLANILDEFYRYMAFNANIQCSIWGDKTPLNVFCLKEILQVFPTAKFIHIYRDGYDVVASYLEMGRYKTIDDAANRWKVSISLCQNLGEKIPEQYIETSYENLVINHEQVLKQIREFLNIEYSESVINNSLTKNMGDVDKYEHHKNVKSCINTHSIGKGREKLSSSQKRHLVNIIGEQLISLGYKSI